MKLGQLAEIRAPVRGYLDVLVDLRGVTEFDPCALLYLVAQVDRLRRTHGIRINGTYPHALAARKALQDARFDDFLSQGQQMADPKNDEPRLQISYGSATKRLSPRDWLALHAFLKLHGNLTKDEADALYNALGECVENVRQHAFQSNTGRRWYALALRPTREKPGRVVVLDLGVGIARTIRRTAVDKVLGWMIASFGSMLTALAEWRRTTAPDGNESDEEEKELEDAAWLARRFATDEWFCVYLATLGLRTQTPGKGRGTGLFGLREAVLSMQRGALHVLSGSAAITWSHGTGDPRRSVLPYLEGTAVCLDVGTRAKKGTEHAAA